ncbi:hypothetical protein D3C85_1845340 [compost metagenome]
MHVRGQRAVLQVGVQFNLVGGDDTFTDHFDGLAQQVNGEVGHTDLAGQALDLGFSQCVHEFTDRHGALG